MPFWVRNKCLLKCAFSKVLKVKVSEGPGIWTNVLMLVWTGQDVFCCSFEIRIFQINSRSILSLSTYTKRRTLAESLKCDFFSTWEHVKVSLRLVGQGFQHSLSLGCGAWDLSGASFICRQPQPQLDITAQWCVVTSVIIKWNSCAPYNSFEIIFITM